MDEPRSLRLFGAMFLVAVLWVSTRADEPIRQVASTTSRPVTQQQGLAWFHDLHEAHKVSASTGKPMLIVFGAPWCHYCRKMEETTLVEPAMVQYLQANFVPVHLDKDKDQRIAQILEVKPIPCTVVLSPDADVIDKHLGYLDARSYRANLEGSRMKHQRVMARRR